MEDSQVVVPQSFIDLYLPDGRSKPIATRQEITARHEVCEDLAQALVEPARLVLWQHGVVEQDVIDRMRRGLETPEVGLTAEEMGWVLKRLAELLEWKDVAV